MGLHGPKMKESGLTEQGNDAPVSPKFLNNMAKMDGSIAGNGSWGPCGPGQGHRLRLWLTFSRFRILS